MKNFNKLPHVWCIDIAIPHERLEEFKKIWYDKFINQVGRLSGNFNHYPFSKKFYGVSKNRHWDGSNSDLLFRTNIITLDTFFQLIEL